MWFRIELLISETIKMPGKTKTKIIKNEYDKNASFWKLLK